jgi:NAD+ diphosphatase
MRPNFYSGTGLDRADRLRNDTAWLAERLDHPRSLFTPVWRQRSLFDLPPEAPPAGATPRAVFLDGAEALDLRGISAQTVFLGIDEEDRAHFAVDISPVETPDHLPALAGRGHFSDLRNVGPLLPHQEGAILACARGMLYWHQRHLFCGLCGHPTESRNAGFQRSCLSETCGAPHFPRTDPAVIMLVHDGGDRCVLGRQKIWPPGMHSTLAGFVEPGESLEESVAREVEEEVGLVVDRVTYQSSQPWPFPSSLMLGFWARAPYQDLKVDEEEIESARWYDRAALRNSPEDEGFRLPRKDSIARRLIEDWLARG